MNMDLNMDFLAGFWCAIILSYVAAYLSGMWRAWRADRRTRLPFASPRAALARTYATIHGVRMPVLSIVGDFVTVVDESGVAKSYHVSECDEIEWTLSDGRVETVRPKQ